MKEISRYDEEDLITAASSLRKFRRDSILTIKGMSSKIGISETIISAIENDSYYATPEILIKWIKVTVKKEDTQREEYEHIADMIIDAKISKLRHKLKSRYARKWD